MAQSLTYHLTRGVYWQRVIAPRDRRTHWPAPSTTATAFMQDVNGNRITIPTTIATDGAILLVIDETMSALLAKTEYYFEVTANPFLPQYNWGNLTPDPVTRTQIVARGTIAVDGVDYTDFIGTNNNPGPTLSQDANTLNLEWVAGDAVSLAFTASFVNWAGTYLAQVRADQNSSSTLLGTLTVTATYNGSGTDFTLTMSSVDSALIPAGLYYWDMQQVGGVTRLKGTVTVDYQVSA